ncbi:MHYT domain-containing protein [Lutibaculum baratangense]|uniref:Putative integral membrane sensor protein n=1 Tax=Lutibaculum baratangense AMV1 TaxID=631454 RepID=V4TI66_9HYPH|nr:MHYT domain-containing protein [Lutibaculum baratangense]ESR25698.1 putative integral membrane sensor protein [Lutibaculum baratangense AMV1]
MLEQSHDMMLVMASLAVSIMASFTGLSLTRGLSALPHAQRKLMVAMAAVALGGGIWSMHFVAMLGLTLPVLFYYDALITLISALVAILMVGMALLVMHFRPRTPVTITASGALVGLGIAAMHYIGMSGIQLCRAVYSPPGLTVAWAASVALGILSFWVVYGDRSRRNILLGTACFGVSVFVVHFVAMGGTGFVAAAAASAEGPLLGNATLAMIVTVAAFVICGAFLLTGITFFPTDEEGQRVPLERRQPEGGAPAMSPGAALGFPAAATMAGMPAPTVFAPAGLALDAEAPTAGAAASPPAVPQGAHGTAQVPYEKDGRTMFVDRAQVAAVRAEGHYTILYVGGQKLFCPWSISDAEQRLPEPQFVRAHRSYLINVQHVTSFERRKDNGICFFERTAALGMVPVSRTRLTAVRDALGL